MKYSLVLLFIVFAISTCSTEPTLQGIDRDHAITCTRGFETVIEDLIDMVATFQEKKYSDLLPKLFVLVEDIKNAVATCRGNQTGDLQVAATAIIITVANAISLGCSIAAYVINNSRK